MYLISVYVPAQHTKACYSQSHTLRQIQPSKSSSAQPMCAIRCMTILHYSPKHNTLFISNSPSLSLGRRSTTDNPLRMSTEVIRDSITVVHLAEKFTAKHDLTVLRVEVCNLCLNLVSCLSAFSRTFKRPCGGRTEVLH